MKAVYKYSLAFLREENNRLRAELKLIKSFPFMNHKLKTALMHADNQSKIFDYLLYSRKNQDRGAVTGFTGKKKDEDEIKQQESEQLKNAFNLLENIVYILTHDLRGPISNMQMATSLISSLDDVNKKLLLLETYKPMLDQMEKTIKDVTDVLQVQKGNGNPAGIINMDHLIDDILSEFENKLSPDEVRCNFSKKKALNYVEPFLLSILRNLITNAIKYRREDVPLKIELETSLADDFVLLKVKDNGIGIDLGKHMSQLFTPFMRINSKKAEGTGIGLYLVKTIIEKNGGHIDVRSTPGEGTTFFCYLKEYENDIQPGI